jgi:DNA-binding NtrC family response regulator
MRFTNGSNPELPDKDALLNIQLDSLRELTVHLLAIIDSIKEGSRREGREIPLHDAVQRFEAHLLRKALVSSHGNKARAARLLRVKLTTFHAKLKRHQIDMNTL